LLVVIAMKNICLLSRRSPDSCLQIFRDSGGRARAAACARGTTCE